MFPHIFHSLNSSKDTSQLIFTLGLFWLHVYMLNSLEKLANSYMCKYGNKHKIDVIMPTKTKIILHF